MAFTSIGRDENQAGASGTRTSVNIPDAYYTAIVEDIVINNKGGKFLAYKADGSNLGQAKIRVIPHNQNIPVEELDVAYPIDINIQGFPLVGEQVIVFKASGTLFYMRLTLKRKLTENIAATTQRKFAELQVTNQRETRELAAAGVPIGYAPDLDEPAAPQFVPNPNVFPIRAYIGDIILQGRYGNSIRMGSSAFKNENIKTKSPNVLLTAGFYSTPSTLSTEEITPYSLTEENINKDKSSIWMVANQKIPFIASTADALSHVLSSPNKTAEYNGAQIFINSDRVILNSKQNEISLFSKTEINLSSVTAITLDTDGDMFLRSFASINVQASGSVYLKGEDISIVATKSLTIKAPGDNGLSGKRIFIGKYGDATQPMVLGTNLAQFLGSLLTNVTQLTTAVTNLSTALSTVTPLTVSQVNTPAITALSTLSAVAANLGTLSAGVLPSPKNAIFNSQDNYVSKANV